MKIRSDYVTNSSSSSYIISYRKPKEKFHNSVLDLFLNFDDDYDSKCAERIDSVQDLDQYFLEHRCWRSYKNIDELLDGDRYERVIYKKAKEALNNGYTVAFKDISYHNDMLLMFADFLEAEGEITVLNKEND